MFKKILIAVIVLAIAMPAAVMAQAPKFGIVNLDAIFTAMPETAAAETQLQDASKKYEEELQKLSEELEKKYTDFQALSADTPDSIKDRRMQEIQELNEKVQQFRNTATQDLQRQQQQLMAPIQEKIVTAINAVGAEGSFTFIFQEGMAYYQGTDVVDVTPLVRTKLGL